MYLLSQGASSFSVLNEIFNGPLGTSQARQTRRRLEIHLTHVISNATVSLDRKQHGLVVLRNVT